MGKMNEIFRLLQEGDKEALEDFFLDRGFKGRTVNIAVREFEKAYDELNNTKKGEDNDRLNTKTSNIN